MTTKWKDCTDPEELFRFRRAAIDHVEIQQALRQQLDAMEDKYLVEKGMRRLASAEAESLRQQLSAAESRLHEVSVHCATVEQQLAEAYEAGKMEQAAQIDMMRKALEYLMAWQVKNVDKWENSAYDFADRVLSEITPDQALEQFAAKVREQCAQMLLNGSFLHDQAPAKLLAIEAAKAIRAIEGLPK